MSTKNKHLAPHSIQELSKSDIRILNTSGIQLEDTTIIVIPHRKYIDGVEQYIYVIENGVRRNLKDEIETIEIQRKARQLRMDSIHNAIPKTSTHVSKNDVRCKYCTGQLLTGGDGTMLCVSCYRVQPYNEV